MGVLLSRIALYEAKRQNPAAARELLRRLEDLPEVEVSIRYRQVIALELLGERDEALRFLAEALGSGYPLSEVEAEPELVSLREDVRYHRILIQLEGGL